MVTCWVAKELRITTQGFEQISQIIAINHTLQALYQRYPSKSSFFTLLTLTHLSPSPSEPLIQLYWYLYTQNGGGHCRK